MKVNDLTKRPAKSGLIGLEIECEGDNLPEIDTQVWRSERDSSLKKANSYEYVLREPIPLNKLGKALLSLKGAIEENNGSIDESVRAGVHVHINVQDMHVMHLFNLIVLYLTLEEVLVASCGSNRQGNLFCLRASDARYLINRIVSAIKAKRLNFLFTDDIRYASINLKALYQYGSVEFRAMRSTPNFKLIEDWAYVLAKLKESASLFESPEQIMFNVSDMRARVFIKTYLGELSKPFLEYENLEELVRNGVDNAQDVAYCVNWSTYLKQSNNPFISGGLQ